MPRIDSGFKIHLRENAHQKKLERPGMISATQIEDYETNGFLVLDSELTDVQIEEIKSEILSSLAEIELRKADDPAAFSTKRPSCSSSSISYSWKLR